MRTNTYPTLRHSLFNPVQVLDELSQVFSPSKNSEVSNQRVPSVVTNTETDHYSAEIDVPGVSKEDIKISSENGILKVSAERKYKAEGVEKSYSYVSELSYPEDVETDNISANFENGVLKVKLPRVEKVLPKQISIE